MNKPATKLATKGTLDTRAMIPKGAIMPSIFVMFALMDSKFTLRLPVYANAIMTKMKTPIVTAMCETFLTKVPAK